MNGRSQNYLEFGPKIFRLRHVLRKSLKGVQSKQAGITHQAVESKVRPHKLSCYTSLSSFGGKGLKSEVSVNPVLLGQVRQGSIHDSNIGVYLAQRQT